jgi:DNA polymerase III epsilon subunit family exonuclease
MSQGEYNPWSRWHGSGSSTGTDSSGSANSSGFRSGNRNHGGERSRHGSSGRLSKEEVDALFTTVCSTTFVALDFETTGLSPDTDRIVEIGAVKFRMVEGTDGWRITTEGEYETLIHPGRSIPAEASAIHGISDLDVSQAPYFKAAAGSFLPFLANTVIVAHNAPFDLGFLLAEARRAGLPEPLNPAYDTRNLAKTAVPGLPSYSLQNLARSFDIRQKDAHRGADDARVCMELFGKCINLLAGRLA